jgi:hypothetical protein
LELIKSFKEKQAYLKSSKNKDYVRKETNQEKTSKRRDTVEMEQLALKIVNNCWNIKISFYLDIYGG